MARSVSLHGDDDDLGGLYGTSYGMDFADYDDDGDMDLFQAEIAHPRHLKLGADVSALRRNTGPPDYIFENVNAEIGIGYVDGGRQPDWIDFDNDADLDLFVSYSYDFGFFQFYEQFSGHKFVDMAYFSGISLVQGGLNAWADYDTDGDLDLLASSGNGIRLFRNDLDLGPAWLAVRLEGRTSNRGGVGARIRISGDGWEKIADVRAGRGYHNCQPPERIHFGLGRHNRPVTVTVTWPTAGSDNVSRHENVAVNRFILVREGTAEVLDDTPR